MEKPIKIIIEADSIVNALSKFKEVENELKFSRVNVKMIDIKGNSYKITTKDGYDR